MRVLAIALFAVLAVATAQSSLVFLEGNFARPIPPQWSMGARADPSTQHTIVLALKQSNSLDSACSQVSDPKSASYGQYLTNDQITALVANEAAVEATTNWVESHGVTTYKVNKNRDFVTVTAPVSTIEAMLQTSFFSFSHPTGKQAVRARRYAVPAELAEHIAFIGGTTRFPQHDDIPTVTMPATEARRKLQGGASEPQVTPQFLRDFYNIKYSGDAVNPKSSQAVAEFPGGGAAEYFDESDYNQFLQTFNLPQPQTVTVHGDNEQGDRSCESGLYDRCGEADLDIQYMVGVAENIPATFWITAPSSAEQGLEPFLKWATDITEEDNPPLVFSVSYGFPESEVSSSFLNRMNSEFQKACARGITVVLASGDDGVAGNDAASQDPSWCSPFHADFPASSPFVTAVGATQIFGNKEVVCSQATGSGITSGGGFSNHFSQPSYQTEAVADYLNDSSIEQPSASNFNAKGRGFPDVAMVGNKYEVINIGQPVEVAGTSASAPVFASLISLVNDLRLNAGQPPVGFANPLLYHIAKTTPSAFFDVTEGDNKCIRGQYFCCDEGFSAAKGWDAATGLGAVNYAQFAQAAMQVQGGLELPQLASNSVGSSGSGLTALIVVGCVGASIIGAALFTAIRRRQRVSESDYQGLI
eukprot:GFYU01002869.1.p1 GENE.GFYU01002869.1~~GFYU01002869.1.p1  ORF type:complete len:645 (+),score=223.97 GFYU01002869.1:133-2067(+)